MPVKSPSEPADTKGFNLFAHDLTISCLAQAKGLEASAHGFGDRRSTHIELRLCMPLLEKEPFLFFAEFLEDHYVEPRKTVFFIFAGIGGTNPRPAERAISPSGVPFPVETHRVESTEQGRT